MRLCFAPMDWITNTATRYLTSLIFSKYKNTEDELRTRTEFMNADGFIINPSGVIKHLQTISFPSIKNNIAQIFWGKKESLCKATEILIKEYHENFSGIELNMWCPSNTVMKCWGWSELLKNREKTLEIIKSLSEIIHKSSLSFSIKTRSWLNDEDKETQIEFIKEISNYTDFISIHWRTLKQLYSWDSDYNFIDTVKKSSFCPIIANWWIWSYIEAKEKLEKYNFFWIMIGQSAIGNPRIFTPYKPEINEKLDCMIKHLNLMIACDIRFEENKNNLIWYRLKQPSIENIEEIIWNINEDKEYHTIVEFRKFLFCYVKGFSNIHDWKQKILKLKTYREIINALQELRENV